MPSKQSPLRKIDQKNQQEDPRQASLLGGSSVSPSTNLTPDVEVPINLTAGATYIVYSHLTPTAAQELSWANADPRTPDTYLVQWSTTSNFSNAITVSTPQPFVTINGLPTATTIYYRVAARIAGQQSAWSASISATTAADTAPPAAVTNAQWQWSSKTGDLTITWTPPTSPNYKDTRVVIRAAPNSTVLREVYAVAGRYVWTRAQQASDTGGAYDSNVVVELTTRNTSNIAGPTVSITPILSAPSNPTGLTASWDGGTCTIRWALADVDYYQLTINSVTRNVGYTDTYTYTLATNTTDHGGTPTPTLTISVRAVDALRQTSGATTITTTAPLPAQPDGLTTNWSSDTGTAEADCIISWSQAERVTYRLTIDGVARNVGQVNRYVYGYALNQQEHAGTADPALTIQLVAVDAFGRASTAATATAINTAPPSIAAPSVHAFFSSCRFSWPVSQTRDFLRYELDIRINSASVGIIPVTDTSYTYETTQSGSIDARVRVVDRFGQVSSWSGYSSQVQLTNAAQFVQELRRGVTYRDSINSPPSALDPLKDSNLTSGGGTYPSGNWQWIEANHGREIRHQTTTFAVSTSVQVYIGTSLDGTAWQWHYGGAVSGGVWVPTQTTTDEATARSGAVTVSGTVKIRLQNPRQCQYIRIGMRNASASYTVREYYPRSLVQADDIAGETLSAISADLGTITAGSISSVSISASSITGSSIVGGTIDGSTITGSTIQTATGGARVVLNSSGMYTYDSAGQVVVRATTSTNGALQVGDRLVLERDKIVFSFPTNVPFPSFSAIVFRSLNTNSKFARIYFNYGSLTSFGFGVTVEFGNLFFAREADRYDAGLVISRIGAPSIKLLYEGVSNSPPQSSAIDLNAGTTSDGATVSLGIPSYARIRANTIKFFYSDQDFLSFYPTTGVIQTHKNPIFAPFGDQYSAFIIGSSAGQVCDLAYVTTNTDITSPATSPRWVLRMTHETERNFELISRNDDGSRRHTVLRVLRIGGHIGFGGSPSLGTAPAGSIDVYGDVAVRGVIRPKVGWTIITPESNWMDATSITSDPPIAYRIHADGTVELRGIARMVSGTSFTILVLPTAARPASRRRLATSVQPSSTAAFIGAHLSVEPNGLLVYIGPNLTLNANLVVITGRYSLSD